MLHKEMNKMCKKNIWNLISEFDFSMYGYVEHINEMNI